jgi:hypothetical protein
VNEYTGYDIVQTAANGGQFEAVVKLVEAGASWRLGRGQSKVMAGSIYYVPEMLLCKSKGGSSLKVNVVLLLAGIPGACCTPCKAAALGCGLSTCRSGFSTCSGRRSWGLLQGSCIRGLGLAHAMMLCDA